MEAFKTALQRARSTRNHRPNQHSELGLAPNCPLNEENIQRIDELCSIIKSNLAKNQKILISFSERQSHLYEQQSSTVHEIRENVKMAAEASKTLSKQLHRGKKGWYFSTNVVCCLMILSLMAGCFVGIRFSADYSLSDHDRDALTIGRCISKIENHKISTLDDH